MGFADHSSLPGGHLKRCGRRSRAATSARSSPANPRPRHRPDGSCCDRRQTSGADRHVVRGIQSQPASLRRWRRYSGLAANRQRGPILLRCATIARMSGFSVSRKSGGPLPSFLSFCAATPSTRQSETAAAITATSTGRLASVAASISAALSTATSRTPAGVGSWVGPETRTVSAPSGCAAAIARPCCPRNGSTDSAPGRSPARRPAVKGASPGQAMIVAETARSRRGFPSARPCAEPTRRSQVPGIGPDAPHPARQGREIGLGRGCAHIRASSPA